jgi:uncharacterized membrane protein
MPCSPIRLLLFVAATSILISLVQVGLVDLTFKKLNLSPNSAMLLLFTSLFGSAVNLPLFSITADAANKHSDVPYRGLLRIPPIPFNGKTTIAMNVGGGLVPLYFSLYLFFHSNLTIMQALLGIAAVATLSYYLSRPVAGVGIAMPLFIAPLLAAFVAVFLAGPDSAPLAYFSGSLGVLIGADLLHLEDVRHMGAPIASIGGAGTFDGIFLTGLVAVALS